MKIKTTALNFQGAFLIPRSTVESLVESLLARMVDFRRYTADTIISARNRLRGGNPSPVDIICGLPIDDLSKFGFPEARIVRNAIEQAYRGKSVETITCRMAATRKLLEHGMAQKIIPEDRELLRLFWQKHEGYRPPKTLTPQQREVLHAEPFSPDPFLNLRDSVIFLILGEANASRMEVEPQRCSIDDVYDGPDGMVIVITGKGMKRRPIRVAFLDAVVVRHYIREREKVLCDLGATHEKALFIKYDPHVDPETGRLSYGISRSGIYGVFKRFRDRHEELRGVKPYTLRKDAVTRMLFIAQAIGIPLEEVAVRNGHPIEIAYGHYNGTIDLFTECLRRTPEEVVQLLKILMMHNLTEYRRNPTAIEHLACARAIMDLLGRLKFNMLMHDIPAGRLDVNPAINSGIISGSIEDRRFPNIGGFQNLGLFRPLEDDNVGVSVVK
jgi:site-specific recombinase XerD